MYVEHWNIFMVNKRDLQNKNSQGFQSADSIHVINLLTSDLFTLNSMWTN